MDTTPRINGLAETCLYVEDVDRSAEFYQRVLGLEVLSRSPRLVALDAGRQGALLLFRHGLTSDGMVDDEGTIPGHEGQGRLHMAFAVAMEDLPAWRAKLEREGIPLAGETRWRQRGGRSLYFRDPDGHAIELATPGLRSNY
ncbi:VOC family protein [Inquilinus sp. Marseille-Q2685]|uniref:VOC family protein n=1 Tax=Inquilinus sp. Marseille-Q2685 TaxID=2866581 RepID=UPI001CE43DC2|nr:VOC family protein [Inquilinus sp. Marseille-Q2685]